MEPTIITNEYRNEEITVTFEPCKCINSRICAEELSNVFRDSVIPWINLEDESTKRIMKQVQRCPSGALKFLHNKATIEKY